MKILRLIGWTEIFIGGVTFTATLASLIFGTNYKSPNVLFFVIVAATISTLLGIGILRLNRIAYLLLLYFASVIFLSKVLILMDIVQLNGALENRIPSSLKDWTSIIYHALVFLWLARSETQKFFRIE